jgi:hypothetical protein
MSDTLADCPTTDYGLATATAFPEATMDQRGPSRAAFSSAAMAAHSDQAAAVFLLAEPEPVLPSKARLIGDAGCQIRAGGLSRREKTMR